MFWIRILTFISILFTSTYACAYDPYADQIQTDTSNFDKNLSASDTDVQIALETLDELTNDEITLSGDVSGSGITSITTTIGSDKVLDSMINWGTGATQVSAIDIPILDSGAYYTGTEIETALQEIGAGTTLDPLYIRRDGTNSPTANISWGDFDLLDVGDIGQNADRASAGYFTTLVATTLLVDGTSPGSMTIGAGIAGIDYHYKVDGENSDGYWQWMEDEARWDALRDGGGYADIKTLSLETTGAITCATITTANNYVSTVATGTQPYACTSTTLNTNLNADLLDSQTGSYYLDSDNFTGTEWTDLTDSGDTTLHIHDSRYFTETELTNASTALSLTTLTAGTITDNTATLSGGIITGLSTIAGSVTINAGAQTNVIIGQNDVNAGNIFMYGDSASDDPVLFMYNSANNDSVIQYWRLQPNATAFYFGTNLDAITHIFTSSGDLFIEGDFYFDGNLQGARRTVTGATTLDGGDFTVLCDASGGAFTVTLPTAVGADGRIYRIKKIESSGNAVTVDGDGTETIDNNLTVALNANGNSGDGITVTSDGANWHII